MTQGGEQIVKVRIPLLFSMALAGSLSGAALANQELAQLSADPNNWAMQAGDFANTRYSKLKQVNASNVKEASGCLDVLNRGLAWARRLAAGHRRHDVPAHAVPQQRLRDRTGHAENQVEICAEAGFGGDSADVLRYSKSRAGVWRWQDLPAAGRQHAGCAGRQERHRRMECSERRPESG